MRGHQCRDAGPPAAGRSGVATRCRQARRYRPAQPASGLPASPRGLPGATRQR